MNGAGKSTLFGILAGHITDFDGEVLKTDFLDVAHMSQNNYFPPDMKIKDLIRFNEIFGKKQDTLGINNALDEA